MDKKELRVLIKYCFLKGKNIVEAKTWVDAEFPDTTPGKSTIKDCDENPNFVFTGVDYPLKSNEPNDIEDRKPILILAEYCSL
ncbi:hypothetical protein GWI33_007312 [Rhynchophorus ferrugineus]|uniref:Mos1 transposase HTH domain-containing protein n=1 Tax=Rhynchophorus ferrugineus TaxID=354439 RepID=A0A834IK10_RHYFE|nr:hypothetical protein GWI33_007312 [Rhynchophorus ferrugineus]